MHSFYAVADIGNGNEVLKLYVEEMNDPNSDNTLKSAYQLQNIEKSLPTTADAKSPALTPESNSGTASNNSIFNETENVNKKINKITQSQQFIRWFGDWQNHPESASKVVDNNGEPLVVYHQTKDDFDVFNTNNERAGRYDSDTPTGMFFKTTDKNIGLAGNKQMAVYLNAKNVLTFNNRECG